MELKISVERFFDLFVEELKENSELHKYYKFHIQDSNFYFRKAYFCQRLQYIVDHIDSKEQKIWDLGCGYATTAIFLVLNGYEVFGSTLEFYFDQIKGRIEYWKNHGDLSGLTVNYESIFEDNIKPNSFDVIIAQDTLHHLEPMEQALGIIFKVLKPSGKLIAVEENGRNIVQRLKLFKQRGNKRIIEIYDETLKKNILLGNENIRSLEKWKQLLFFNNLELKDESIQYVRMFPPKYFTNESYSSIIDKEQSIWKKNSLLKKWFFFGLNFIAIKNK